ncbi:MAG TPA: diacylglycerol kinase family protein [Nocardioidaceae bacterium]|nr:diacylglycerol kinase family protein [Nocardioidaceae bacterium]
MGVNRRAAALALGTGAALLLLTALVAVRWQPLMSFDAAVLRSVQDAVGADPALQRSMRFVAVAFAPGAVRVVLLVAAALLAWRGMRRTGRWLAVSVGVEFVLVFALKRIIDRPRPALAEADGWAFPSGHASGGALFGGVLIVLGLLVARRTWHRVAAVVLGVAFALLLGADRLILGEHYPSDVLGSYLLVPAVLAAGTATLGIGRPRRHVRAAPPTAGALPSRKSRLAVVLNPIKVPDAKAFRRMVNDAAERSGWDNPMWFETSVDDAGRQMTHAALTAGADVVVAAGGDGTVRVVASELARTGVALGILPVGTGNLLARNLSLPLQMDTAMDVVLAGQDRAIDLVRMTGDDMDDDHFAVMGGLGLDAAIMQGAPDELKKRVGWPAYFIAGLQHFRDPAFKVEITVDDAQPVRYRARTVVIGNVGTLTGGIPLLPDAAPDDGRIDVVVVAPRRFVTWIRLVVRVLARRRVTDERLDRRTGRRVVVRAEHATARQMDGDVCGVGKEITATVEPGVLLVRVPR